MHLCSGMLPPPQSTGPRALLEVGRPIKGNGELCSYRSTTPVHGKVCCGPIASADWPWGLVSSRHKAPTWPRSPEVTLE